MQRKILYVGGFVLPDKNAAAQRVIGNAKALRALGHQVYFLNYSDDAKLGWEEYEGFRCFNRPKQSMLRHLTSIWNAKKMIRDLSITDVIAYNYPAIALSRLIRFCRNNQVRCIADATEWYVAEGNLIYRFIKTADTWWRMKRLHFQTDGVIAISEYLYQYYNQLVPTVKIPPLADISVLPHHHPMNPHKTVFLYAGSPCLQKERLDLIVDSINRLSIKDRVELHIVGITEEQYGCLYGKKVKTKDVHFLGRVEHSLVLEEYRRADWSIVFRDNNLVVKAGFPTKVSESISCGVPVIANKFSNITEYLNPDNSILCDICQVGAALEHAANNRMEIDNSVFDYNRYTDELAILFG